MADVFISYARENKEFTHQLCNALQANNKEVWIDWKDILPTSEWQPDIYEGIESSDAFICILSPDYIASQVCREEAEYAIACKKRLVPIVYRDIDPVAVDPAIAAINWLYFRDGNDRDGAFTTLLSILETDIAYVHLGTNLLRRAREWQDKGGKSSFLQSRDLTEAERWLGEGANKTPSPTSLQIEYITASRLLNSCGRIYIRAYRFVFFYP